MPFSVMQEETDIKYHLSEQEHKILIVSINMSLVYVFLIVYIFGFPL